MSFKTVASLSSGREIVNNNQPALSQGAVLLTFFGFILILFLAGLAKKIWYRYALKKRYYIIPRTQIKGIANIAMVISMATAIIFSVTILSANGLGIIFRAYIGTRLTIEGILIKIGGLLFGPFLGIFIGAFTDLLTVILTSGIFHYGFFISAMGYGLLSGLVKTIIVLSKNHNFSLAVLNSFLLLILGLCTIIIFQWLPDHYSINSFIKIDFLSKHIMMLALLSLYIVAITMIWILLPFSKRTSFKKPKTKFIDVHGYGVVNISKKGHNYKDRDWYSILTSVILISILSQVIIDVFMLPVFDVQVSTISYGQWFAMRFIAAFVFIVFNSLILFLVYWVISPIITYQYVQDMVESIDTPIFFSVVDQKRPIKLVRRIIGVQTRTN